MTHSRKSLVCLFAILVAGLSLLGGCNATTGDKTGSSSSKDSVYNDDY